MRLACLNLAKLWQERKCAQQETARCKKDRFCLRSSLVLCFHNHSPRCSNWIISPTETEKEDWSFACRADLLLMRSAGILDLFLIFPPLFLCFGHQLSNNGFCRQASSPSSSPIISWHVSLWGRSRKPPLTTANSSVQAVQKTFPFIPN